jgi:hypothetical protein
VALIRELPLGDPVTLAGAAALIGGVFALLDPFFRGLTEAGAALAAVGWIPRAAQPVPGTPGAGRTRGILGGASTLAVAVALFVTLPPPFDRLGALLLGGCAFGLSRWIPAPSSGGGG